MSFLFCLLLVFPQEAVPAEAVPSRTIKWSTASEQDNFGFDIYRGESEEGPYVRLNANPIPGAGNSDEPHLYRYVDATIAPDKAYYYYVESISMNGLRERFTPIIAVPPFNQPRTP